jgi:cell division GTPase FtsZ
MTSLLANVTKIEPPNKKEIKMDIKDKDTKDEDDTYINPAEDDWGFVGGMDESVVIDDRLLPDNVAETALNCGFIGVGGGGGKLAKAFLDLGFNKTLLINTTSKDQPAGVDPAHFLLVPGSDGVGKDVTLGKKLLTDNSALVEDACRSRLGKLDWLFVLAGGGGGTGSACHVLDGAFGRYLKSLESESNVVYIISRPSAQELLNPAIQANYETLRTDVADNPHFIIDNEKQLQLLRGKVGMMNMYPAANTAFAKTLHQVFKLAATSSEISAFDSIDLERCLSVPGRIFLGSTIVKDPGGRDLGATVFQGSIKGSACPAPTGHPATGVLLLLVTSIMASDPDISNRLEAASAYVGGRADTLFSGVYVNDNLPGLIALTIFGGMKE